MPRAEIRYSKEALSDLASIFEYIAADSQSRAMAYIDKLEDAIGQLEDNPNIGVSCKRKLIRQDCRVLIVDSYLVFYRFDSKTKMVKIIRVLRDKQDYSKQFK